MRLRPSAVPAVLVLFVLVCWRIVTAQAPAGVPEAARSPLVVPGVSRVVDAAIGNHFYLVVRSDGSVLTWGYNNVGQLGNGRLGQTSGSAPGTTLGFVVQGVAQVIDGVTDVKSAAAGGEHALVVRGDGSVWGWGSNGSGQLALGRANSGANPRPLPLPGLAHVTAVAAYNSSSYALLENGTVLGWGDNLWRAGGRAVSSPTPIPVPGLHDVVTIVAGLPCLALLRDGHVVAWGSGFLGDGNPAQRDYVSPVVAQPAPVTGIENVVAIATGASRSGVVLRNGSVWVWGDDSLGGLGLGKPATGATTPARLMPTQIPGITDAVGLALGSGSSIVGRDGTLRTWGDQRLGATGRPGIERTVTPTRVAGVSSLVRVWASSYSNLGLLQDGRVLAWGSVYLQQ